MVCNVITKLKSEKSIGLNGWPIEVINVQSRFPYQCPSYLTNRFSIMFFLMTGRLPTSLQYIGMVSAMLPIIIYYRQVSLTSTVVWIMESTVKSNVLYLTI